MNAHRIVVVPSGVEELRLEAKPIVGPQRMVVPKADRIVAVPIETTQRLGERSHAWLKRRRGEGSRTAFQLREIERFGVTEMGEPGVARGERSEPRDQR